jgi:hypothetical protein
VIVEALMRKILVILGILLLALGVPGLAGADTLWNAGFEYGDLSLWMNNSLVLTAADTGVTTIGGSMYEPPYGHYLAVLKAGLGTFQRTELWQSVGLTAGQVLSGWALFDCRDGRGTEYNDTANVIVSSGTSFYYQWTSTRAGVGPNGHTGWEAWSFTAPAAGYYTLSYEIYNGGDNDQSSWAYFDSYQVPDPVPLPEAVWLLGSGLLGLIGIGMQFKS